MLFDKLLHWSVIDGFELSIDRPHLDINLKSISSFHKNHSESFRAVRR